MTDNEFGNLIAAFGVDDLLEIQSNIDCEKYPQRAKLIDERISQLQGKCENGVEKKTNALKKVKSITVMVVIVLVLAIVQTVASVPDDKHGFVVFLTGIQKLIIFAFCLLIPAAALISIAIVKKFNKQRFVTIVALIPFLASALYYLSTKTLPYELTVNAPAKTASGMFLDYRGAIYKYKNSGYCNNSVGVKVEHFPMFKLLCIDEENSKKIRTFSKSTFLVKASDYGAVIAGFRAEYEPPIEDFVPIPIDSLLGK